MLIIINYVFKLYYPVVPPTFGDVPYVAIS